jgi:hypothetical protein
MTNKNDNAEKPEFVQNINANPNVDLAQRQWTDEVYATVITALFAKIRNSSIFTLSAFLVCAFSMNSLLLPDEEFDAYLSIGMIEHYSKGLATITGDLAKSESNIKEMQNICAIGQTLELVKAKENIGKCELMLRQNAFNIPIKFDNQRINFADRAKRANKGSEILLDVVPKLGLKGTTLNYFNKFSGSLEEVRERFYSEQKIDFAGFKISLPFFFSNFPIVLVICFFYISVNLAAVRAIVRPKMPINQQFILFYPTKSGNYSSWGALLSCLAIGTLTFVTCLFFVQPFGLFPALESIASTVAGYIAFFIAFYMVYQIQDIKKFEKT